MPLFAFIGYDGPRGPELRKQHRPAHLENLQGLADAGQVVHAGPLLAPSGAPVGSVIVFEADDLGAARAFASRDPYVLEGVFSRYTVHETNAVFSR